MSKKKNKKFKKSNLQKTNRIEQENTILAMASSQPIANKTLEEVEIKEKGELELLNEKYQPVRRDVKKLLLVLASLLVLFITAYFVGAKTSVLVKTGDWLYRISNIQTQ